MAGPSAIRLVALLPQARRRSRHSDNVTMTRARFLRRSSKPSTPLPSSRPSKRERGRKKWLSERPLEMMAQSDTSGLVRTQTHRSRHLQTLSRLTRGLIRQTRLWSSVAHCRPHRPSKSTLGLGLLNRRLNQSSQPLCLSRQDPLQVDHCPRRSTSTLLFGMRVHLPLGLQRQLSRQSARQPRCLTARILYPQSSLWIVAWDTVPRASDPYPSLLSP